MFLSAYHFDGDSKTLAAAYDRLLTVLPTDDLDLHVCVVTGSGITVFDACPSRDVFEGFSRSPEFLDTVSAAGLLAPRLGPLGEVRDLRVREGVGS